MVESFRVDRLAAGGPPANRRETITEPAFYTYAADCRGARQQLGHLHLQLGAGVGAVSRSRRNSAGEAVMAIDRRAWRRR